ncbi:MAG: KAP family NTPase [Neptuniibacter sp.]
MHFKISTINDTATFDEDDLFYRVEQAEAITSILSNSTDPLVISLEAEWGQGKTTFVHKWGHLLEEHQIPYLYIDAYKGDFNSDAFLFLASEIYAFAKNNLSEDDEVIKNLKSKVVSVGGSLLKAGVKTGLQVATAGLFNNKAMDDFEKNLSTELTSCTNAYISNAIENYSEQKEDLLKLSKTLTELAKALNNSTNPLIVIVDELDRCRPSFALELLEVIKHLFSAKNVSFILVNNPKQMRESIKLQYGTEVDAGAYLRKFYDLSIPLSQGERHSATTEQIIQFAKEALLKASGRDFQSREEIAFQVSLYYNTIKLSLRDIQKIAITIALLRTVNSGNLLHGMEVIISAVAVLYVMNRDLLIRIYYQQASPTEIDQYFKFKSITTEDSYYGQIRHQLFSLALSDYSPGADQLAANIIHNREHLCQKVIAPLLSIRI